MSDNQKVIFSILGAVVGHLLLFLLLGLLFAVSSLLAPQTGEAAAPAPAPQELTIMLADLMEQVELTPKDLTQRYMRTDADQESLAKPENAPFHSDRNTLATSQRPPDPASDLDAPTVVGRTDLPFIEIRDREFVDGEFLDQSVASAPSPAAAAPMSAPAAAQPSLTLNEAAASKPTPIRDPSEQETEQKLETDADPSDRPKEAPKTTPTTPAEADTPPDKTAEKETQPDAPTITDTPTMALRQESVETPFAADPVAMARPTTEPDRDAEAKKKTDEFDEAAAPETPLAASAMPVAKPFLPSPPLPPVEQPTPPSPTKANSAAASPDIPPNPKPPSDSPAFTPETRARSMQGNVDNIGNTPSFNVEASALGKYKKLVTQAVERQWHRYRQQNGAFVTYGTLKVKFRVDREGTPRGLKIVKNEANAVMADFTLRAVLDADIPPMPADVASMLGGSGLEITYDVIVY
jgi:outer membrane biosynthesis protein TonB